MSHERREPALRSRGRSVKSSRQTAWKMSAASSRLARYLIGIEKISLHASRSPVRRRRRSQSEAKRRPKPRELAYGVQRDPEIDAVAAGVVGKGACSGSDRADRRQVGRLPEGDAVAEKVRHQNALPIEGGRDRAVDPVAGQGRQDGAVGGPDDGDGTIVFVGDPDVRSVVERESRARSDGDRLKDAAGAVELQKRAGTLIGDPDVGPVVERA